MRFLKSFVGLLLLSMSIGAYAKIGAEIKKFNTSAGEVIWIVDDRFPTFNITIYFADGALSDQPSRMGETTAMFDLLTSGTNRYGQKEIAEHLEYYGVSYSSSVTHEYSQFKISGLVKDIIPVMKLVCHNFRDAIFPDDEIKKYSRQVISSLKNISTNPSAIAERAFRMLSLEGTPYKMPADGVIKTISKIKRKDLAAKLDYFNKKVKKRIYLAGPERLVDIKEIFAHECGWDAKENDFVRENPLAGDKAAKRDLSPQIHLVTIPSANQGQIRIGRYLAEDEVANNKMEIMSFASSFLAGGFTAKLMQELRVKRGLTYGVSSFLGGQKYYGRSGIVTSIRNDKVLEGIEVVRDTLAGVSNGDIEDQELSRLKGYLAGGYLFQFEEIPAFVSKVVFFDHIGRAYDDIYKYKNIIALFQKKDLAEAIADYFSWEKQKIVVVGDKSLLKDLSKLGKVKVSSYKDFL